MISVSQEVIDLINADSRTFRAKFKHGDSAYDKIMSLKWNVCLPSSSFSVGNALSIGIQCTAFDVPVSIKGEELELVITIEGSADEISIGSFTAEKPTIQNGIVSFNAYDDMSRAGNIPYNSTLGEGKHTVNQYVADVAEILGIGYISLGSEGEVTVENDYLSGNSCRNALAYLAGYLGRNCVIKNKKISMKKFTLVDYTMNADRIEEPELEDIDSEIDFIIVQISSNNTIMNGNGATGTELVCPIMTESQLSNVANMLFGDASPVKTYRTGKIKLLLGDPRLELCDVIKLDYKDTEYIIPITSISFEYDGGLMTDIEAYALKEPTLLTPSQRLDFAVQEEVKKVLEQLKNIDGTYFYIRYSPNADGSNMTEEPDDKTEYIGVCSTNQSSAPGEASAYTWSKFKGKDGSSNFFHVKYSNDGGKTFTGTNGETAGEYIGILVDSNEDDSTNPSDYTWSKIVGKDGKGISEVINYYLTTDKADGVTRDDFGGNTEIVTPDKDKPYLWNYEEIRYTSGNPTYTDPCIIGNFAENGLNGRGIKSITEYYLTTKDSSTPQKSSFKDTVQTPTPDLPFLWNYEKIIYTDGSTPYESEVRIIGVYGEEGRGVSKVETEYRLSTSDTSLSSGYTWGTDAPSWQDGLFLWTRLATTYTDNTTEYSDPVVDASWKKTSVVDAASKELNETLANALGLHVTEYPVGTSKIRYYHSNPSLTDSKSGDTILVFNAKGFGVCTTGWNGGNPVFQNGAEFEKGKAVWNILAANKISADLIEAGVLSSHSNSDLQTKLDLATGILRFIFSEGQVTAKGFTVGNEADLTAEENEELKWVSLNRWPGVHMNMATPERNVCAYYTPYGLMVGESSYIEAIATYAIQRFKYECGKGTEPLPLPDYLVSEVGPDYISSKEVLCSNLVYLSSAGREKKLKDLDSNVLSLSAECESLRTSLTLLQQKYAELLEEIGKTCEHPNTEIRHENVVSPTCTEPGSYDNVVYCATCGEEITDSRETITTDALGHNYTSVVTPPTSTSGGYTTHTCQTCGSSYTDNYTDAIKYLTATIYSSGAGSGDVVRIAKNTSGEDWGKNQFSVGDKFCFYAEANSGKVISSVQITSNGVVTTYSAKDLEDVGALTVARTKLTYPYNLITVTSALLGTSISMTVLFEEPMIYEGVETSVNIPTQREKVYLKFVPQYSGSYTFESFNLEDLDPDGYIYNADKSTELVQDRAGSKGFSCTYDNFVAGNIYYLAAEIYNGTGTLTVKVSYNGSSGGSSGGGSTPTYAEDTIVDGVLYIGTNTTSIDNTYQGNTEITKVIIPNNVTGFATDGSDVGGQCFRECTNLTEVVVGSGITKITYACFFDCSRLAKVTIPASVTTISEFAFGRTALTDVYYKGNQEQWTSINIESNNTPLTNATIHYNS